MMNPTGSSVGTADEDYQPISALNDLLYCERRCALHRIEQLWVDTAHTVSGTLAHGRVHAEPSREELGAQGTVVRGMWLRSQRLRLVGKADAIELPAAYPIEYKHGRRRRWDNDDVQLCAQALCLEEMLGVSVTAGAIFHVKSRRRREVVFDDALREKTEQAARRLHQLVASGVTPPAVLKPQCDGCSLHELCMPELMSQGSATTTYIQQLYTATTLHGNCDD